MAGVSFLKFLRKIQSNNGKGLAKNLPLAKEHPAISFTTYLMRFVRYGYVFTEFFYYVKSDNVFRFSFVAIFKQLILQNTFWTNKVIFGMKCFLERNGCKANILEQREFSVQFLEGNCCQIATGLSSSE